MPLLVKQPGARFPRVNRAHSAAGSLLALVDPPHGELLTATAPTIVDSHGVIASGEAGLGSKHDQGGGANTGGIKYVLPAWAPLYNIGSTWSAILVARVSAIGSNYRSLVGVPFQSNGDNPYYAFSPFNAYGDTAQGVWITVGGSLSYYNGLSNWFLQDGLVHTYYVESINGTLTFDRDGVLYNSTGTVSAGTPQVITNKQPLWLGCANQVTLGQLAVDSTIFLTGVYSRTLSPGERLAFAKSPFSVLDAGRGPVFFGKKAAGGGSSYTKSVTDSVGAPTDAITRAQVLARAIAQSVSASSDSPVRSLAYVRAIAQSIAIPTEAPTRALAYPRAVADSAAAPTEAPTRALTQARVATESVSAPTEAPTRAVVVARASSESLAAATDAAARVLAYARGAGDSVSAPSDTPSYDVTGHINRGTTDSVAAPSDAVARVLAYVRAIAQSVAAATEAPTRALAYPRAIADSAAAPTEAPTRALAYARAASDSAAAPTDAASRALAYARSLAQSVAAATDAATYSLVRGGVTRGVSESVGAPTDNVSRALTYARAIAQSVAAAVDAAVAVILGSSPVDVAITVADATAIDVAITLTDATAIDASITVEDYS